MNNESLIGKISVPEVIYEDGPQGVTKSALNNSDTITYEQTSSVPNACVIVYDPDGNKAYRMSFEELKMKLSTV